VKAGRSSPLSPLSVILILVLAVFAASTFLERAVPSGTVLPKPGAVRLEVLNGCGRKDAAAEAARVLRKAGFDVVRIGNADRFNYGPVVIVDRTGKSAAIARLASFLRTDCVVIQRKKDGFFDATVVVGHAFRAEALHQ